MKLRHLAVLLALLLPVAAFGQNAVQTALDHITTNYDVFGVSEADVSDLAVTDAYTSRRSGTTHVYVRQRYEGIDLADANINVNVDRDGDIFHVGGGFEIYIAEKISTTTPVLTAADAAYALADDVGLSPIAPIIVIETEGGPAQAVMLSDGGIALEPIPAHLVYHVDQMGVIHLAWEIGIYEVGAQHYWSARVDAINGDVLARHDLVVNDVWVPEHLLQNTKPRPRRERTRGEYTIAPMAPTAAVNDYRVFPLPIEAPTYAPVPPPADGRTLENDPADATASPFGWHDTNGASGNEFTILRGNNTHTYLDRNGDNVPDAGAADCGASIICDFDFPIDFGTDDPILYQDASETSLFYWTNVVHDVMFDYGFDSPGGNFQVNTYGQGGIGNDDVRAEGQDGGGNCNANFFTPVDGSRPRMQMFECTIANPDRDGDYDHLVIAHEYAHGISNRLVGGPANVSCLNNLEQMGEGWSDWIGLLLTIEPGDAGADSRGVGDYLFGQPAGGPGIRPTPYSTNFGVNPRLHADICTQVAPHGVGYVWATILWEVTWHMIDVYGWDADIWDATSTAGNNVMLQLVIEGMKLMPCSPGFVDARDGIIQADVNLYGGSHVDDLWVGFAARGLGIGASQGSTGNKCDNTNEFTVPVELVSFDAVVDDSDVVLNWFTSSETNNAGFEVQHRAGGGAFEALGFVEGHGTTTIEQSYSFRAEGLDVGVHTFRLKQIDFDGAFEYHPEVEVTIGVVATHVLSEVYPNPFNPQAQFTLAVASSQNVIIAVYDVMGRQVAMLHEGQLDANETYGFTVDGTSLASGAYYVRVIGETFADTQRITLLK